MADDRFYEAHYNPAPPGFQNGDPIATPEEVERRQAEIERQQQPQQQQPAGQAPEATKAMWDKLLGLKQSQQAAEPEGEHHQQSPQERQRALLQNAVDEKIEAFKEIYKLKPTAENEKAIVAAQDQFKEARKRMDLVMEQSKDITVEDRMRVSAGPGHVGPMVVVLATVSRCGPAPTDTIVTLVCMHAQAELQFLRVVREGHMAREEFEVGLVLTHFR